MRLEWLSHDDPEHARALRWLSRRINENFETGAVGVVLSDAGELACVWVWHNWQPDAGVMEFSGASLTPRWMTRRILHALFAYAFERAGCQMVVTRNSAANESLHKQLWAFGFDRFDIPRLFGRREDGVVWTMTDDQWRAGRFFIGVDRISAREAAE